MIPTYDDLRILFEGKPEEYLDLYRDELDEILTPDEDDDPGEFEDFNNVESLDTEELFEILFAIPITKDDDYCEVINMLADEYLSYDVDADFEEDEFVIYVDENRYVIDDIHDGYSIVRKFNKIIKSDFEIRVMKMSLDEDNIHSLIILKNDVWKNLEAKYGTKVAAYFGKIDKVNFI
ncbi:MAG: hypothetical protein LBS55_00340 [Prevotellaceae bacterium]|jgi:hypothetical protein|nr:hypothetical protein [Prevotellaceae bacterium]